MDTLAPTRPDMQQAEHELLSDLRRLRRARRLRRLQGSPSVEGPTRGQKVADVLAGVMGSWTFIVLQTVILFLWIAASLLGAMRGWGLDPFILLNLALSFQAAYTAPVILMSQNRQRDTDRKAAAHDYHINVKAELEIELLHEKIDHLRDREVLELTEAVGCLTDLLQRSPTASSQPAVRPSDAHQRGDPPS